MTRTQGRELLAAVSALLYRRRLTELCGGNMSLRAADEVIMTPTKSAEEHGWRLEPADMIVFSLTGDVIEGDSKKASRESDLHLRLYEECPDVNSVFHLHLVEAIAGQLVPEIAHHWSLASGATSGGAPSSRPLPTGPRGASGGGALGAASGGGANSGGGASGGDGPSVSVLDARLQGQTEEHDRELALVIKHLERASGAVVVAPGHGVFTAAPDSATNVRAVEMFRHSLRYRLIARQLGGGKTNA
jgi:ribulose-5-phosphate 4-epimerase/fuculose-1-phosphate aldolase